MKMVKSLLLGSAAGLVAIAGAQAADLPVKAKPVQYVKICTLYGDGFYYIPGSDTCIRFSGYIRADYGYNVTGARTRALLGCGRCARPHGQQLLDPASWQLLGRHPDADCLRHAADVLRPTTCKTRTRRNRPTSPARSSSGAASPSAGRCRSPTTKAASATPACALCTRRRTRAHRRQRHQPDRLYLAARQRRHSEHRRRRTSREVDREPLGRAAELAVRRHASVEPTSARDGSHHPNPWVSLRVNQAWGRASVAVIANHNEATYYSHGRRLRRWPTPARRCAAIRTTSGAGR